MRLRLKSGCEEQRKGGNKDRGFNEGRLSSLTLTFAGRSRRRCRRRRRWGRSSAGLRQRAWLRTRLRWLCRLPRRLRCCPCLRWLRRPCLRCPCLRCCPRCCRCSRRPCPLRRNPRCPRTRTSRGRHLRRSPREGRRWGSHRWAGTVNQITILFSFSRPTYRSLSPSSSGATRLPTKQQPAAAKKTKTREDAKHRALLRTDNLSWWSWPPFSWNSLEDTASKNSQRLDPPPARVLSGGMDNHLRTSFVRK